MAPLRSNHLPSGGAIPDSVPRITQSPPETSSPAGQTPDRNGARNRSESVSRPSFRSRFRMNAAMNGSGSWGWTPCSGGRRFLGQQ